MWLREKIEKFSFNMRQEHRPSWEKGMRLILRQAQDDRRNHTSFSPSIRFLTRTLRKFGTISLALITALARLSRRLRMVLMPKKKRTPGMMPVEQELLETPHFHVPELPGLDAGYGGGSRAGLKNGHLTETIPHPHPVQMDVMPRHAGGHVKGPGNDHVETGLFPAFLDENLAGDRGQKTAVTGQLFAGFVVHEGEKCRHAGG